IQNDAVQLGTVLPAMAAVTDDIVLQGFGLCFETPCVGRAAVQKEIEREVADHLQHTTNLGPLRVTGDTLTSRFEARSDRIKAAGIERILVSATTVVRGDKITSIRWVLDSSDAQTAAYLKTR